MIEDKNMYLHGHIAVEKAASFPILPTNQPHWFGGYIYIINSHYKCPSESFQKKIQKWLFPNSSSCRRPYFVNGWPASISLSLSFSSFFFSSSLFLLSTTLLFFPSISVSSSEREGATNVSNCVWLASEEENVIVALLQQILKDVQYLPLGFRLKM